MARKKDTMAMPTAPKAPSMDEQLRWSAESMARTAMDADPKMKRRRDQITRAVVKAAKGAIRNSAKSGRIA